MGRLWYVPFKNHVQPVQMNHNWTSLEEYLNSLEMKEVGPIGGGEKVLVATPPNNNDGADGDWRYVQDPKQIYVKFNGAWVLMYETGPPIEVTVLVASDDASDDMKTVADFVCDGVDDQVQVQAAIDQIKANSWGGTVQLSEGFFRFSDGVDMSGGSAMRLVGAGAASTKIQNWIQGGGTTGNINNGGWVFLNMGFAGHVEGIHFSYVVATGASGNAIVQLGNRTRARDCTFEHSGVEDFSLDCVSMGTDSSIDHCLFLIGADNGHGVSSVFDYANISDCLFEGSSSDVNTYAIWTGGADYNIIHGNTIKDVCETGIIVAGDNNTVTGNVIVGQSITVVGIALTSGGDRSVIDSNVILSVDEPIIVQTNKTIISNNVIDNWSNGGAGILIENWNCVVTGNILSNGSGHGIKIDDGDDSLVVANNIDTMDGDGIHITSGTVGMILGDNLMSNITGADLNDLGTGTINNDPLATKGDLYTYSTVPFALPIGTDDQVLIADSVEDSGLKWVDADPLATKGDIFTYTTVPFALSVGTDGDELVSDSTTSSGLLWREPVEQETFLFGPVLAVETGLYEVTFKYDIEIIEVEARVAIAPTATTVIVDVQKEGGTDNLYTTQGDRPTIATATKSHTTTPNVTAVAAGEYITVDVDQKDSDDTAVNLSVIIRYRRA